VLFRSCFREYFPVAARWKSCRRAGPCSGCGSMPTGPLMFWYPTGAQLGQPPSFAFSCMPFFTSSLRFSIDEQRGDVRVCVEEGEHLAEAGAPGALRCLVVAELNDDVQTFALRVRSQQVALRGNAESLLRLLLAAHPRVEDCISRALRSPLPPSLRSPDENRLLRHERVL